ncbi:peptide chain release factor N(5)-glutamine methyltransferase [Halalkalibacterium ligniniphilum]|uniref:peptide chain release factor N(5)-glutamine methyltransferase n=1 Tax=Halalkalibacterium ligniniphilum TaxID=1134413 RepID=UPI000475C8DD|nr:peptide chain release factor N(5)-glutamine methyltransferase [Halalkalibacterium ligniniphilum]
MRVYEALQWASSFLADKNGEQPAIEWLLRHHLNVTRTEFFLRMQEQMEPEQLTAFQQDIRAYATGVPVQHLIGYEMFYGRPFRVNRHVLIPRPETEELVLAVLKNIRELFGMKSSVQVVDIGTGSGAIGITLALEERHLNVTAVDLSEDALQIARKNAESLQGEIEFVHGDLLLPFLEEGRTFDVIVSNPPYIPLNEKGSLAANVVDHEPHLALFGGDDGLEVYRRLAEQLPRVIKDKGIVAFEIGAGQGIDVQAMLQKALPQARVVVLNDINGKDRIVLAVWG